MKKVSKVYKSKKNFDISACKDIDFSVNEGDIFGVVGYSGAGKSTLLRLFNSLETPTSGKVIVNGKVISNLKGAKLRTARKELSMIFQEFNLMETKTVYDNLAIPLILNHVHPKEIKRKVSELLSFVGLSEKIDEYTIKLSGGQKQRVGIARALANDPKVLLCDEPTSALDPKTTESILELLKKVNKELNITILMITHQISAVQKICNKVAVMKDGAVVEIGDLKKVFKEPQKEITQHFVNTAVDCAIPKVILDAVRKEIIGYFVLEFCHKQLKRTFLIS